MGKNKGNFPELMREAGFRLRQYREGPLDWRQMGSYETDRILREQNIEVVDDALQHLSEAPLGTVLETHILDSGIAKYFIMSQYAIQYLLYCRTYLDESVGELREAHEMAQNEIAKLRQSLSESNNEVVQLHKKITQIETIREVVFPCHLCTKNFISNEALNIHIGRKHRVGTPTPSSTAGAAPPLKDNDVQLITTIKMELEIKKLKERLNAAERNIKERKTSPRRDQSTATYRNVGIQSNLAEPKEKDEFNSEAQSSEASERKEQLHGLAERLSNFEAWQAQLKQNNDQFIQDINQKFEDINRALEQSKQAVKVTTVTATPTAEDRVATPCLEDLERILTEKVAEIGKISANKLEEVVYHLEMGYKDKLDALERELKRLSVSKEPVQLVQQQQSAQSTSKIPKAIPKPKESNLESIKRKVESEFVQPQRNEDTYSIEELPASVKSEQLQPKQPSQPSASSSGSPHTYTKPPPDSKPQSSKPDSSPNPKSILSHPEFHETTDISESLSDEEQEQSNSDEDSEIVTSEPERQVFNTPKTKTPPKKKSPQKPVQPLTRKDARKLVNLKLNPHGFDMKTKKISSITLKRISAELVRHRNNLRLEHPHFYATRNRIRMFVDKLCSAKLPENAKMLLKKPMDMPKRSSGTSLVTTEEDDEDEGEEEEFDEEEAETQLEATEGTSYSQEDEEDDLAATPTSEERQQQHQRFKAQLEQMLAKPAARVVSRGGTTRVQLHQEKPVPLPRKRVMFNTLNDGNTDEEN